MSKIRADVPAWVRIWTCLIGSTGVPGLLIASAYGANIGVCVAGPVALYGLYVASLAFGRRDGGIRELAQLMSGRRPN